MWGILLSNADWDCFCEECEKVQAGHAPRAGVAQGIFHGILVRHQGWTSGRGGRGTGGRSRETGEETTQATRHKCACMDDME